MFVFDANGRVQKVAEGILFYEQDVLCSAYSFTGDQKIELNIDYMRSGFGIAVIEEPQEGSITQDTNAFLFKLGINDFRVYEKLLGKQKQTHASSCRLAPGQKNIKLTFTMADKKIRLMNEDLELGTYTVSRKFERYRIGIYSNAGNIIKSLIFLSYIPRHWRVSTLNTLGGRIAFERDLFRIENCEQEAEVQQEHISLAPGRYWLKYEKEKINGVNDIRAFIFHTELPEEGKEEYLEDDNKNILDANDSFVVRGGEEITLKFKGHNGITRDISIANNEHSGYVETANEATYEDGSEIRIELTGLKRVKWNAQINALPPWEEMIQDCPYAVVDTKEHRYTMEDLSIEVGRQYAYSFDVPSQTLTILDEDEETVFNAAIPLTTQDKNTLVIMKNVTMIMTDLVLEQEYGEDTNVVIQKTFKRYVPDSISSPIIVTKNDSDYPFDLSAAYREVVEPRNKIALFNREQPILLKEELPANSHAIKLYGIPSGAKINVEATDIKKFSTAYALIAEEYYKLSGRCITINESIRDTYAYIAVQHSSISEYTYEFTNYEREVFDGDMTIFSLEKNISKNNEDIIVYGIPNGTVIHEDLLYRVPNAAMINSIDYYADIYDELPVEAYSVIHSNKQINLHSEVKGKYQKYVVDYLKNDSYCLNHRAESKQYEIDIATDSPKIKVHYDMHDDGGVYKYLHTNIHGNEAGYVVLRRKETEGDED